MLRLNWTSLSRTSLFGRLFSSGQPLSTLENFQAKNEPTYSYVTGSKERVALEEKLQEYNCKVHDVPLVIGDEEIRTQHVQHQVRPFDHNNPLAKFYYADQSHLSKAIDASQKAVKDWERTPLERRCEILLRAADLVAGKYRMDVMAATMLGQGKTIIQGEIDSTAELADFLRFNSQAALDLLKWQPISPDKIENRMFYRGMEGFWAAIAPFNFTAIGGNLASAPALMGNVVLWKPSDTAILSSYVVYQILREAGVPAGVINFVPADGPVFGDTVTSSPLLAGINFTGSSKTFMHLWKQVANNLEMYKNFPRLVGECGGKNFHMVHPSANLDAVLYGTICSAFEYSGQKCSACSRLYVPASLWPNFKEKLAQEVEQIKVGSPLEYDSFLSAVIDDKSFARVRSYVDLGKKDLKVVAGAEYDDSKGYFVRPTVFETKDPQHKLMQEEIFGPVLTVYPYEDGKFSEMLQLVDTTSPYGLTGSIYAEDPAAVEEARAALRFSTGNFYINDRSTGSVVCQQPFGGSRKSGTNDKAGSPHYVLKFTNPLSVKTAFTRAKSYKYPYMEKTGKDVKR